MTVSLILNERPIPRSQVGELPNLPPSVAIVYPVEGAPWEVETIRTRTQRWLGKNRSCYAVDLSDHRRIAKLSETPLTCDDGGHRFEARIDVGFRAHDPVRLVRGNVQDAQSVVYGHLTHQMRLIAAGFPITEAPAAQTRMNQAFAQDIHLAEGITIYHCTVQLEPDTASREFIRRLREAERQRKLAEQSIVLAEGQAWGAESVEDIKHQARLAREERERKVLAGVQLDFAGLVREHLTKHPNDTHEAMGLLMRLEESRLGQAEIQEQRHVEMVKYLIDKGVVRDVDLPGVRNGVLGASGPGMAGALPQSGRAAAAGPAPAIGPGHAVPAPGHQAAAVSPQPGQAPVRMWNVPGAQPAPSAPATGLVPVYVVLDASAAASGCATELGNALRSLQTLLANSPDVSAAVRLSVLSYADTAEVLLPLTEVTWQTGIPDLRGGPGCRYSPAFRKLLDLVPLETERLKQQVARVLRPVVFLLAVGDAEDTPQWGDVRAELMQHKYHPHLVACGIGGVGDRTVERLASRPELGVVAVPGADLAQSAVQFSVLLQNTVLHLGRSALAGGMELRLDCPQGLIPVKNAS
ncbi:hypothetical protein [Streptomyces sp. NPDC020681]|uniref:hypothetical protein n=1 Tax=Streptomyces sp. NPDC020681 TaxID=3365083 RepID=UPI0037B5CD04